MPTMLAKTNGQLGKRWLDARFRCRKCEWCLRMRAREWQERCAVELQFANRTWFATFTVKPAFRRLVDAGISDSETPSYRRSMRISQMRRWLQLYFKVLRKRGFKLRHCPVAELHKDGWPHFHAFIHEWGRPMPKRFLQDTWAWGFTNFKLVEQGNKKAVFYLTKYMTKQNVAPMRPSLRYGSPDEIVKQYGLMPDAERVLIDPTRAQDAMQACVPTSPDAIRTEYGSST